jgi:enoyl-CoA hydratase/carnithine racemase
MGKELLSFWRERQNDHDCRVIIMTGAGTSFCSGGDIDEMDDKNMPFFDKGSHKSIKESQQ